MDIPILVRQSDQNVHNERRKIQIPWGIFRSNSQYFYSDSPLRYELHVTNLSQFTAKYCF